MRSAAMVVSFGHASALSATFMTARYPGAPGTPARRPPSACRVAVGRRAALAAQRNGIEARDHRIAEQQFPVEGVHE